MQLSAHLTGVEVETALKLGLRPEEYDQICQYLGRKPNFTEISVYSVMWSEHCSYKNSILWLKKLPNSGSRVLAAAGEENAGLMDLGDGLGVAFKIESHNHPSAIEPYQGAATGVGGIQRDIFTMGARPICSLNSLRFGNIDLPKTRHLLKGVVKGIGDYGNAFGVPTVAGEIYFDDCYNTNPLVNAMAVGIVEKGKTISAIALGKGNPVFIVGSATGRDGIHGAAFASKDISEDSAKDLPSVQVGDPFTEKLLLEATLELIDTGAVIGMQDMGAAGITCSTSEMSAKGNVGMDVWLDKVPTREPGMKPFEILLSESQERMLVVVKKGMEEVVMKVFDKWDLHCAQIGVVTDGPDIRYFVGEELVGQVPARSLVLGGGAPVYEREMSEPGYMKNIRAFKMNKVKQPSDLVKVTEFLIQLPSIASKRWVTRQYDSMVGAATMSTNVPSDAAVVNIAGTKKAVVVTTDCNSRYVAADARIGCAMAVAEAARNIACSGGTPLGVTNCLNFGNPYNPEVYWTFAHSIMGMRDACEAFGIPVTGGNVSFYNQSEDGPVYPTPTIGMVGMIEDVTQKRMSMDFKKKGDVIYLIGEVRDDIGSSEYLYQYHKVKYSPAPAFNLDEEVRLVNTLQKLASEGLIQSAHDISEGGLMITLLECGFHRSLGFSILADDSVRLDAFLFGESGGRAVVSVSPKKQDDFEKAMEDAGLPLLVLGEVTGLDVEIDDEHWGNITHFSELYLTALEKKLNA